MKLQSTDMEKTKFLGIRWIDTLNDNEMLKKMKKSGFKWLGLGIGSSSKHVRDGVVKGRFNNYNIEEIVKSKDMGFYVGSNYILVYPMMI